MITVGRALAVGADEIVGDADGMKDSVGMDDVVGEDDGEDVGLMEGDGVTSTIGKK